jgi:hypothetical protein
VDAWLKEETVSFLTLIIASYFSSKTPENEKL